MTQIDDILYSPVSLPMDWSHLWADLDRTNQRMVKNLLGNLRHRYDNNRGYYPDPDVVDFAAKLTAYVIPKLFANHIVSVQTMADRNASVIRLEHDYDGFGNMRLSLKSYIADSLLRRLSCRVLPNEDYSQYLAQIGNEIIAELDQDLLSILRSLPEAPTAKNTFDISVASVSDEYAALLILMMRESAHIAVRTRRAKGNRAVISPAALTILDAAQSCAFMRDPERKFYDAPSFPEKVKYCGLINSNMQVFVDEYADAETPILISYKGDTSIDGGMIWAPYVVIDPAPQIIDPNIFELIQPFKTDRAYLTRVPKDDDDAINASANWFGLVGFNAKITSFL